jgi:regulator of protease activity HflC (stomatin/prohibitin superfamily)
MKKLFNISLFVLLSINLFSCREKIDAGSVGLLISQYGDDKGQGVKLVAGATWYNPATEDVVEIPAYVQHKEYQTFVVSDYDGSNWDVSPKLNYRINTEMVANIYRKYRQQLPALEEGVIKTIIQESYRIVFNNYKTDSILRSRELIERQVKASIISTLTKEGFIVEQITSGMKPPSAIMNAINAKNKAVQDAMRIENEVKSTEAEGMKKIAAAKAAYEATLLNAKADAEANRLRQQTLTPMLIQQQFIEKWDGELPTYGQVPSLFKSIQ